MSIEDLDSLLGEMMKSGRIDNTPLWIAVEALLMPESAPLKRKFLYGEENALVPDNPKDAVRLICHRASTLMEMAGQDASTPRNIAFSVGLYCYGAVLCTSGYGADEFVSLFRASYSNFL